MVVALVVDLVVALRVADLRVADLQVVGLGLVVELGLELELA